MALHSRRTCSETQPSGLGKLPGWVALLVALTAAFPLPAEVLISEIHYHPASTDVREEYVELLNTGPQAVNLNGWRFSDGIDFTFTNVSLPAGGYLVVAADLAIFTNLHPAVTNVVGNWQGQLSNSDEDLDLDDALGNRVDSVHYADEGDWAVRQRGPLDRSHRGWIWHAPHDGGGMSLELINPWFSNNHGQNWSASLLTNGTPSAVNSVFQTNLAPVILEVQHLPPVPSSVDPVLIAARLLDERGSNLTATVHWRVDGAPAFTSAAMFDDGGHDDGSPGDGVFAVTLPAQAADAVVEFYLEATDADLLTRTWPAAALDENGAPLGPRANALYQVDDSTYTGAQPLYKLIMTEAERTELAAIGNATNGEQDTDAQMNGTFISVDGAGTVVRYTTGIRNRGHGSRNRKPNSYRVNFSSDRRWKDVTAINLNGQYTHAQIVGAVLALKSGLAGGDSRAVQVRVNNVNLGNNGPQTYGGVYAANEVLNSDWAEHWLPADSAANVYRALRDLKPDEFNYRGEDPEAYRHTWFKTTNEREDYWTDLIAMLRIMGTNDLFSAEAVRAVVDVEQWMTYLAVMALLDNRETSPNVGENDDYFGYAGRLDPRFRLLPYDNDTILGQGNVVGSPTSTLFGAAVAGKKFNLSLFMHAPEFEPVYYRTLQHLLDTSFSEAEFNATLDQTLGSFVPAGTVTQMKTWMNGRRAHVQSLLTPYLAALSNAPVATVRGQPRSPTPLTTATLSVGGEGVTQYRYALDNGAFGPVTPLATPITLTALTHGSTHSVRVIGAGTNGLWQAETQATVSAAWVVDTNWPAVYLSEVLAANATAFNHSGTFPDAIELHNEGAAAVNLSGLRLSDRVSSPNKFIFPNGTTLAAGARLVVLANNPDGTPGFHTGFSLSQEGEGVFLFNTVAGGGALLDSVEFGLQLPDLSIGRVDGGVFQLTQPTFGTVNIAQPTADPRQLRINEWLASGFALVPEDFIELHNPSPLPVALGGLFLTDNPIGDKTRHRIPPLSFGAGGGHLWLVADGDANAGADHVDFKLSSNQGLIALLTPELEVIDCVAYGPQRMDVSEGRTPDGAQAFAFFAQPSPGAPNPSASAGPQPTTLVSMTHTWRYYQQGSLDGVNWTAPGYEDSAWPQGAALLYVESDPLPAPKNTLLSLTHGNSERTLTYYFRTHFTFTNDPASTVVQLYTVVDDGSVVHLNGTPVHWLRLPQGSSPDYNTLGSNVSSGVLEGPFALPGTVLHPGDNVIAVEVHQTSTTSSDVCFGLQLETVSDSGPGPGSIVLNEVLAANRSFTNAAGRTPDWVELLNTGTNTLNLADLSLSDETSQPRKWVFPPGTTLAGGARRVIEFDDTQPASATNTGFALAATGDSVLLFERPADGGAQLDGVTFGVQVTDFSLARVTDGSGAWTLALPTPGAANVAAGLGSASALRINEWMASPASGDDWFELYNPNLQPVALSGLALTDDASNRAKSPIPPLSFVAANGFAKWLADDNTAAGADHVGFQLSGDGDFIGLYRPTGTQIDGVTFGPQTMEVSQGRFTDGAATILPFSSTASPGGPNHLLLTNVVINELLSHTDPPLEDAVELLNLGAAPLDISGWHLSNSGDDPRKFLVPSNTVIAAHGFKVFYEYQFGTNTAPGAVTPFNFNSAHGDEVHLAQTDGNGTLSGYRAVAKFGAAANGISFGRFLTSIGPEFVAMSAQSFGVSNPASLALFRGGTGAANPLPLIGPACLSEIHFHPTNSYSSNSSAGEFIELRNLTAVPLPFHDPAAPTNTWSLRGGVTFEFPMNVVLPANGALLVVGFNPADLAQSNWFRATYAVPMSVPIFGPWSGSLANEGEALELYRPDPPQLPTAPDAGFVPQILIERVVFQPTAPWPTNGLGTGASLQRRTLAGFGNEPLNWFTAAPSAGLDNLLDTDGDGLPDWWEVENGLDPLGTNGVNGASGNLDGDALTNLEEWLAGTRADDPLDHLRILSATLAPEGVRLRFAAAGGITYSILASEAPAGRPWLKLTDVPAAANPRTVEVPVSTPTIGAGFYRIVTPAQSLP